jgi:hypothetical protein
MSTKSNFTLNKFMILVGEREYEFQSNTILSVEYFESVDRSFVYLAASIDDSTLNFSERIYGLEKVELVFTNYTKGFDGTFQEVKYSFTDDSENGCLYVYSVYNKSNTGTKKTFTLGLCRLDAINDKFVKISKKFEKKSEEIVEDVLKNYLKSKKKLNFEKSVNKLNFVSPLSSAYSLINWMLDKCVSVSSQSKDSGKDISAGYMFYESYDSYNFFSVDGLCARQPLNPLLPYMVTQNYQPGDDFDYARDAFIIKGDFMILNSLDVFKDLEKGFFSNKIAFFDVGTQTYDEEVLNVSDYYSKMNLLGSQKQLPNTFTKIFENAKNVKTTFNPFDSRPSRLMTIPTNDYLYSKENVNIDYKKVIGQSIIRYGLLGRQVASCRVYGNLNLKIGEIINVELYKPNNSRDMSVDKTISGKYLIYTVSHLFNNSGSGGFMVTDLILVRDSYGY